MAHPPFRRRERSSVGRVVFALLGALLFHAAAVGVILLTSGGPREKPAVKPQAIAMRALSAEDWARNRGESVTSPQNEPERVKPPKETPIDGQVVAVVPGNQQKPPPDTRFLAEKDNRTDKQTVAKDRQDFRNVMERPTTNQAGAQTGEEDEVEAIATATPLKPGAEDGKEQERQRVAVAEIPKIPKRTEVELKEHDSKAAGAAVENREASKELRGNSDRLQASSGQDTETELNRGEAGATPRLKLLPSASVFGELRGGPAPDGIDDVEEGDATSLNTREYKYAAYFNAIKNAVYIRWQPMRELAKRDPSRQIYGLKERETRVAVTIGDRGQLISAVVLKSCGVDFLDMAATGAYEKASPFLAPPPGLLNDEGVLRYVVTFTLEATSTSGLQIVRGR